MNKLKLLFPLLSLAVFTACGSGSSTPADGDSTKVTDTPVPVAAPVFDCKVIVSPEDGSGNPPRTVVSVKYADSMIEVDSVAAAGVMTPDQFALYEIPADAITACGGYFAGAGDYFYITKQGADYVVMYGYSDEQAPESEIYKYKEVKRFPAK